MANWLIWQNDIGAYGKPARGEQTMANWHMANWKMAKQHQIYYFFLVFLIYA